MADALAPEVFLRTGFLDGRACRDVCAEIRTSNDRKRGTVVSPDGSLYLDDDARQTTDVTVSQATEGEVFARLEGILPELEAAFGVPLRSINPPRFLAYGPGDFYVPHRDSGSVDSPPEMIRGRKVSVVVFLNGGPDGDEPGYEGGQLALYGPPDADGDQHAYGVVAEPGLLVAFRSSTLHEVRTVTAGERFTVVTWIT